MATVMVVGSGGREMAQALALAKSAAVAKVLVAPGNGGTASCHPKISNLSDVKDSDVAGLVAAAKKHAAGLVAIGPEAPLVAGIADALAAEGIPCFGPTKMASELENSKAWMKEFFVRHDLPTARHLTFTDFAAAKAHVESIDYPVVVKASGLAGGKGVRVRVRVRVRERVRVRVTVRVRVRAWARATLSALALALTPTRQGRADADQPGGDDRGAEGGDGRQGRTLALP
jgi:phosphoribosylamine-glycine ligase